MVAVIEQEQADRREKKSSSKRKVIEIESERESDNGNDEMEDLELLRYYIFVGLRSNYLKNSHFRR